MRQRVLVLIIGLLVVSVTSAIAVLAYMSRQATIRSLREQQDALTQFAVGTVELGVSTGRFGTVQKFLSDLAANPLFAGAIIYDADSDVLLSVPDDFEIPSSVEQEALTTGGSVVAGDLAYQAEALEDQGEVIGYLLLAVSFESINREARDALVVTALVGFLILLPVTIIIAWILTWMEKRLRERELRLAEVNREIEIMLNNLDEGIFTFSPSGTVNAQHSSRARQLFGIMDFENATFSQIFDTDHDTIADFQQWLALVSTPRFLANWEHFEQLNPIRELISEGDGRPRIITVRYRPIIEDDSLKRIMVLASDVTDQREAEAALNASKRDRESEMARILSLVQNDRSSLDGFLEEAKQHADRLLTIESLAGTSDDDWTDLCRDLHTLKGNAGSFGFTELESIAHRLEDVIASVREGKEAQESAKWNEERDELLAELDRIEEVRKRLYSSGHDRMGIDRRTYERLLSEIRDNELTDTREIQRQLWNLDALPFATFCERYQRILELYRQRHDARIDDLQVDTPDQSIHRTFCEVFDDCVMHLVRNALAHGIEKDEVREAKNKGPGLIRIAYEESAETAQITLSDNGGGIDPEAIMRIAVERRIITEEEGAALSEDERIELIFRSGFSTQAEANDISGRGVGMDAVRTQIEEYGGTIALDSQLGEGLTVTLTVPKNVVR